MFHAAIEDLLHFRSSRIDDDTAVSERAGSPFGASLVPAHDFSFGDEVSRLFHQFTFIAFNNIEIRGADAGALHCLAHLRIRVARSPIGMIHDERARLPEDLMMNVERGANRQPSISCSRLDVNV